MKWNSVSRRLLLQGAGGAFLTLPWLESMKPREARAAGARPKRFIAMKTYNHPVITRWYPNMQANGYTLKKDGTTALTKELEPGSKYRVAPLADFVQAGGGISTNLGPFLNKHLPKLTLIRGLDFLPDTNHNYSGFLGNYASCDEATPVAATLALPKWPTIDQVLAYSPKFYATPPAQRSLHVGQGVQKGVQWSDGGMRGGRVVQGSTTTNPLDAYNKMFSDFSGSQAAMPDNTRQLKDASLVDRVYQDYVRLKNHRRLSSQDRQLLEQYAALFQDLHTRIRSEKAVTCTKPGAPPSSPGNASQDRTDIRTKWELFVDIIVASILCDRTRVFTLDVRKVLTNAGALYHNPDGVGGSWHGAAHRWGSGDQSAITEGHTWAAQNIFLRLVEKLDVPEEGGSTYLDNSLIYWGGELGFNHINYSVICLLAGSAGGFIKTGRYIDYIDWNSKAYFGQFGGTVILGIPHNQFCVTVLQAMGLSPADYERPGIAGFGETKTTNKNPRYWATEYDLSKVGQILPGIRG